MPTPSGNPSLPQALGDHLLVPTRDGAVLVFGLSWSPLIGSRVDVLARRKARESRATHYVHGGVGAAAVGCARLRGRAKACYAAAQIFAALHAHGTAAGLLPLDDGRVWLVASRNGAVMARGDRIHANEALAREALAELDALHPGLAGQARALSLDDLSAAVDPAACLWRVGQPLARLPLPVQGSVLLIVLALLGPPAWRAWQRAMPAAEPARIDAAQAWRDALSRATASVRIHDADELARVFATLRTLPVALRGWTMRSARCRPEEAGWACFARYARTAPDATNRALASQLPTTVRASFVTLNEAQLHWRVAGSAGTLSPDDLSQPARTDLDFASTLQAIGPAFARIALGAPAVLAVAPPRDERGAALPAPADLPRMRQRNVVLQGPLRSFALFARPRAVASWTGVGLELYDDRRPDIAHSPLMAQLEGTVYERE
ncbi:type 4b pilus protein PilO2 [Bordetella genomosp. 11]|uniref:Type 4b pilus protein PilO2 n=1 Tax=Bordetella genomosp. 11 TaxID=1416808 RepID=A0A261UD19_9BORD|nr:type 4b pilus protein PilO2 [Bordetella genomosp. 11]OZI59819.1 hypothetical protein CAL28_10010 [Bordetella genomosp. 11]